MVAGRCQVAGGEVLGEIGASLAAAFDRAECADVIDTALDLLDEADGRGLEIAIGLAIGPITTNDGMTIGAALERAQELSNRARGGELVLDARARDAAKEDFLLGRQVVGASRGTTIDRKNPRRVDSADAIAELHPAVFPPIGGPILDVIAAHLDAGSARTFILRGPVGAGASELISALATRREHDRFLSIGAAPGGVVPLASLRLALLRRYGSAEETARKALALSAPIAADALGSVAAGELVDLDALAAGLAEILGAREQRTWVVLSPLSLVDGATLAALLEARTLGADFVLFGRLPLEAPLPRPLLEIDEDVVELVVPPLKTSDARVVAEAVLGMDTDSDVARRIAVLGGDTVIGVVEAARTLIAAGELVKGSGDGFVWRSGPRDGVDSISTAELIGERLARIDTESRQVLEALCVVPDGANLELVEAVAARDGIGPATFDQSLERLARESFARGGERPRPASSLLRWGVVSLTPPARSIQLHRLVGEALENLSGPYTPELAERGYYLIEGGLEGEGRPLVTAAVEALVRHGYRRAARHLSSWLYAKTHGSAEVPSGRTSVPPRIEAQDEGPPSSEAALDELLDEIRLETPPPDRPPRHSPPEPEPVFEEIFELSEEEMEFLVEDVPADELELELDELAEPATIEVGADLTTTGLHQQHSETTVMKRPVGLVAEPESGQEEAVASSETTSVGPAPMAPLAEEARTAIRRGDQGQLEHAIERAIARGRDLGTVERIRAIAQLAAGDLAKARASLESAHLQGGSDRGAEARYQLAMALVSLRSGDALEGIRCGLAALAGSRDLEDPRGEVAALRTLAACYRAVGRESMANRIESHPRVL